MLQVRERPLAEPARERDAQNAANLSIAQSAGLIIGTRWDSQRVVELALELPPNPLKREIISNSFL
jgi:hypothetical protein